MLRLIIVGQDISQVGVHVLVAARGFAKLATALRPDAPGRRSRTRPRALLRDPGTKKFGIVPSPRRGPNAAPTKYARTRLPNFRFEEACQLSLCEAPPRVGKYQNPLAQKSVIAQKIGGSGEPPSE